MFCDPVVAMGCPEVTMNVPAHVGIDPFEHGLLGAVDDAGRADEHGDAVEDGRRCNGISGDVLLQVQAGKPSHRTYMRGDGLSEDSEKYRQYRRRCQGNAEQEKDRCKEHDRSIVQQGVFAKGPVQYQKQGGEDNEGRCRDLQPRAGKQPFFGIGQRAYGGYRRDARACQGRE